MLRPSSGKRDGDKQKERKRKRKKEGEKWLEERPRRADNSARYRGGGGWAARLGIRPSIVSRPLCALWLARYTLHVYIHSFLSTVDWNSIFPQFSLSEGQTTRRQVCQRDVTPSTHGFYVFILFSNKEIIFSCVDTLK